MSSQSSRSSSPSATSSVHVPLHVSEEEMLQMLNMIKILEENQEKQQMKIEQLEAIVKDLFVPAPAIVPAPAPVPVSVRPAVVHKDDEDVPIAKLERERCTCPRKDGTQCNNYALKGSKTCTTHIGKEPLENASTITKRTTCGDAGGCKKDGSACNNVTKIGGKCYLHK